jgi:hypothetical protein
MLHVAVTAAARIDSTTTHGRRMAAILTSLRLERKVAALPETVCQSIAGSLDRGISDLRNRRTIKSY